MGLDCFWLGCEFKNNATIFYDVEELNGLKHDIFNLLYEFLSNTLTRKAEANYLKGIDDYMGWLKECYIEKDGLFFCLHDYCDIISMIALHWFELTSIIYRQEIEKVFNKYNLQLRKQEIPSSLKQFQKNFAPYATLIIVIKDELYLIDEDEKTVSPDESQTQPILSEEEKETIFKIIESKECQCQLCEKIRAGEFSAIAP